MPSKIWVKFQLFKSIYFKLLRQNENQQSSQPMRVIIKLILLIIIISLAHAQCHYSCTSCTTYSYQACTVCPNNSTFSYIITTVPQPAGTCAPFSTSNANALGILLIILVIFTIPCLPTEEMVHLVLFCQTLGLFYLIQVYWTPLLDYILAAFSYLMLFTRISHNSKPAIPALHPDVCKGRLFFNSFNFVSNITLVGIVNIILFGLLMGIPWFKNMRKKCVTQRVQFLPDWILDKISLALSTTFLFIIQETTATIYFSLCYDTYSSVSVAITVLYFITLVAFTVNQFFYPLPYFRNKIDQITIIIGKCFLPIFLSLSTTNSFVLFPLAATIHLIDIIATNKNKHNSPVNRLFAYKILELLCICLLMLYYILEYQANKPTISQGLGIACFVGLLIITQMYLTEILLQIKRKCRQAKQKQEIIINEITQQDIQNDYNKPKADQQNFEKIDQYDTSAKKPPSITDSILPQRSENNQYTDHGIKIIKTINSITVTPNIKTYIKQQFNQQIDFEKQQEYFQQIENTRNLDVAEAYITLTYPESKQPIFPREAQQGLAHQKDIPSTQLKPEQDSHKKRHKRKKAKKVQQ